MIQIDDRLCTACGACMDVCPRQAIHIALASCLKIQPATSRIMRIQDTKHVETFWASEPLLADILEEGRVTQTGELREIAFDSAGMLVD